MNKTTSAKSLPGAFAHNNSAPSNSEINNCEELLTDHSASSVQIDDQTTENCERIIAKSNDESEIETGSSSIATDEDENGREVSVINHEWHTQRSPIQIESCIVDHNKNEIGAPCGKSAGKNGDSNFINCSDVIVTENQTNNITYKEHYLCPDSLSQVIRHCSSRRCLMIAGALTLGLVLILVLCLWLTNRFPPHTIYSGVSWDSNNTSSNVTFIDDPNIPDVYFVRRIEWLAQPAREPAEKLWVDPAPYVIIGQTETDFCFTQSQCILHVRYLQFYHIESNGWNDIGYNFLVGGDGQIYEGRGWGVMGAHTKGYNARSVGIGFIGTFNNVQPNSKQIFAARELIKYAEESDRVSKDYKLVGYRQCRDAEGSGEKLYDVIKTWEHWSPTC